MSTLIGTAPDQVPVNGMLGDMAFQNKVAVTIGTLKATTAKVGGTTTSVATLDVTGTFAVNPGNFFAAVDSTAQFVISGTTASAYIDLNPSASLGLRGNIAATAGVQAQNSISLRLIGQRWTGSTSAALQGNIKCVPQAIVGNSYIAFGFSDNNDQMVNIKHNGSVLIGNTVAVSGAKLEVTGAISATTTIATGGYTVATLPTGVVGARAYVTNALTPTWGSTVVTGGAVTVPVFYNGTNWIVG